MKNFMISIQEHFNRSRVYFTDPDVQKTSKRAQNIKWNQVFVRKATQIKISLEMTIDLANTFDKKLPSQNTRNDISEEQDFKTF